MNGGEMQNFDIATGNFGVEGTMLIPQGRILKKITEYIRNQLKEDAEQSQLTMDFDPFTGSK